MLKQLYAIARAAWPTATEEGKAYDGPLSTWAEVHALLFGVTVGVVAVVTGRLELAAIGAAIAIGIRAAPGKLQQVKREPWAALAGLVIGLGVTMWLL